VGLASFDLNDPDATFRPIEPFRPPPPDRGPVRALLWPLRLLVLWLVNLAALAVAGLLVTNVGAGDPFAYVAWALVFGLVNACLRPATRPWRSPLAPIVSGTALPFAVDILLVWLMTVTAPPFHAPDLGSIARAATVMWLVNLPLRLLVRRRVERAPAG